MNNLYCWSCGKPNSNPAMKNCEICYRIYRENPFRTFTKCRCCKNQKEENTFPLCKGCYIAMKERNKKGY